MKYDNDASWCWLLLADVAVMGSGALSRGRTPQEPRSQMEPGVLG